MAMCLCIDDSQRLHRTSRMSSAALSTCLPTTWTKSLPVICILGPQVSRLVEGSRQLSYQKHSSKLLLPAAAGGPPAARTSQAAHITLDQLRAKVLDELQILKELYRKKFRVCSAQVDHRRCRLQVGGSTDIAVDASHYCGKLTLLFHPALRIKLQSLMIPATVYTFTSTIPALKPWREKENSAGSSQTTRLLACPRFSMDLTLPSTMSSCTRKKLLRQTKARDRNCLTSNRISIPMTTTAVRIATRRASETSSCHILRRTGINQNNTRASLCPKALRNFQRSQRRA
ncbi:uncharacterized protein BJ171DRAFT_86220 [Polychytrium aggregatum]|uniref:uncharacterized protein n=1 Tax=Polychytrium aggregatum TaxID=110093 RepID=UPI0022FE6632|nr:uncharacterized protein BJ171DRAFT_86220 [Polychytrium aggregatum]KAI9190579.1 hypothetical protein BJ171DRAFT_86220 [Polychytrium aggregatum]